MELEETNITQKCFPMLQDCATKVISFKNFVELFYSFYILNVFAVVIVILIHFILIVPGYGTSSVIFSRRLLKLLLMLNLNWLV